MSGEASAGRATAWLSCDLIVLADELEAAGPPPDGFHFDVVIVGSGYGGGVVLSELAGYGDGKRPLRIAMLERGAEYLPGAFPSLMSELPGHVRFSEAGRPRVRGREGGLFDLRVGPDVIVVLANGLGGGSLINAGVMAVPLPAIFQDQRWPAAIRNDPALPADLAQMQRDLGAAPANDVVARTSAMNALGGDRPSVPAAVTVSSADDPSAGLRACVGCGDCATGCNFGAKISVDVGLIASAVRRHAAGFMRLVTGATVETFAGDRGGWKLSVQHTDPALRKKQTSPYTLTTRRLVLCAGTLGSTEVMLRANAGGLVLSKDHLGRGFSGNGDNIVTLYGTSARTMAVADEQVPFADRGVGPTITRTLDLRSVTGGKVIQDLAVPGPLRRMLEEVSGTADLLDSLARYDGRCHREDQPTPDPFGIDQAKIDSSMVLAVIGQDDAKGTLVLPAESNDSDVGTLSVVWPELRTDPRLDALHEEVVRLAGSGHPEAKLLANPAWRPLSPSLEGMVGDVRGPTVTVHPLGGCRMAESASAGVVNELGQVFSGSTGTDVYKTLTVLDGSIVPMALGINPSLTIATLARRGIRALRGQWGLVPTVAPPNELPARPIFRVMPAKQTTQPTHFELTEQMSAESAVSSNTWTRCKVDVQLWFEPVTLAELTQSNSARVVTVDPTRSRLRITGVEAPTPSPGTIGTPLPSPGTKADVLLEAPVQGTMQVFSHAPSCGVSRALRALAAWGLNRGLRDAVLGDSGAGPSAPWWERLKSAWNLASRAGDRRLIQYDLTVDTPAVVASGMGVAKDWQGQLIKLTKTVSYERAANPVNQLMEARVDKFPSGGSFRLEQPLHVDLRYFGRAGYPLLRIQSQDDQVRALVDTTSLLSYIARVLLPLHAWTFRLPDRAEANVGPFDPARRLPGSIPGIEPPHIEWLTLPDGAQARLAHYRPPDGVARKPRPVLMIHGYSASGTTFAHELLPQGGLAGALCRRGHDVWVLDLRSSCGMPRAQEGWLFEQMGCQDIPRAIAFLHDRYNGSQVDVVAHCMGAAMFSLGLFGYWEPAGEFELCPQERKAMAPNVARIVFSQVGPAVVMTPSNTARAYIFQWLRHYLSLGAFEFRPSQHPSKAEDMMDRLLCAVPYPRADFFRENPLFPPKRTPWVAQRHRMDALYGITFKLDGIDDAVLDRIDEFFGPLSLKTVAQVIAFARSRLVTDSHGDAPFMQPSAMKAISHCKVLCLHAKENGLADYGTRDEMLKMLQEATPGGTSIALEDMGHQDSLIGRHADLVYAKVATFLV